MSSPTIEDPVFARRSDLDALRAVAMVLGIGLHASLSFFPLAWVVTDDVRWVRIERGLLHVGLFVGFAIAAVVLRTGLIRVLGSAMIVAVLGAFPPVVLGWLAWVLIIPAAYGVGANHSPRVWMMPADAILVLTVLVIPPAFGAVVRALGRVPEEIRARWIPQEPSQTHGVRLFLVAQRDLPDALRLRFQHFTDHAFGEDAVRLALTGAGDLNREGGKV